MGSSPCRRIPLLGIAHLLVGKHLHVLEVHQEVDTFEVLVGKNVRFWLCYVIRNILDSISNFVYVNENFCNKKVYFDLFNIVLESFPRFYTACVICIEAIVLN